MGTVQYHLGEMQCVTDSIVDYLGTHEYAHIITAADVLDMDRRTVSKRFNALARIGALAKTRHGYRKTERFGQLE